MNNKNNDLRVQSDEIKKRRIPMQFALGFVIIILVGITSISIGVITYLNTKAAVDSLSNNLFVEISDKVLRTTKNYLENANKIIKLNENILYRDFIDNTNYIKIGKYFAEVLNSHSQYSWASFGDENGTFIGAYQKGEGKIGVWQSEIQSNGKSHIIDYLYNNGNLETLSEDFEGDYDPRKRGWYSDTKEQKQSIWTDPYLFYDPLTPGITYTAPLFMRGNDKQLKGVFTMDFALRFLSKFLKSLKIGENGKVFILTDKGEVIAHTLAYDNPKYVVKGDDDNKEIAFANESLDNVVIDSFKLYNELKDKNNQIIKWTKTIKVDGVNYIVNFNPLPIEGGLKWGIFITVPEDDFLGIIKKNNIITLIVCGIAFVISILLGMFFSKKIHSYLKPIFTELDNIGKFVIDNKKIKPSLIKEINNISDAIYRTKNGLTSFEKYVPSELVRQVIESGMEAKLGGDVKKLTVFFSDIASFTSISEKLTAKELVILLGDYLGEMSDIITEHKGTLDKYIGDAIMAFWGAPKPVQDHAYYACLGAIKFQKRLTEMNNKWQSEGKPVFNSRIGLNTGELVVGNMGSNSRLNYTVIGDNVNLASRLEGINKLYGTKIIISQNTYDEVSDLFKCRLLDIVAVKGKEKGIKIYELICEKKDEKLLSNEEINFIAYYEKGFDLYINRKWDEAISTLNEARKIKQDDKSAITILKRSIYFKKNPNKVPKNWSGTIKLNTK